MRTTVWATVLTVGAVGLAGCSSSDAPAAPRSLPPETTSRWATASVDPQQLMAMEAAEGYREAREVLAQIEADPQLRLVDYPKDWAITDHLSGGLLDETVRNAAWLKRQGLAMRGGRSFADPSVKTVKTSGRNPSVVFTLCPKEVVEAYEVRTGQTRTGYLPSGAAKPPYLSTSTMTRLDGKWKMTGHELDWKSTCGPS